eukprot:8002741-Pyramimonas_sp.AAC.1
MGDNASLEADVEVRDQEIVLPRVKLDDGPLSRFSSVLASVRRCFPSHSYADSYSCEGASIMLHICVVTTFQCQAAR